MKSILIAGIGLVASVTIGYFIGRNLTDDKLQSEFNGALEEKNNTIDKINTANIKLIDQNALLLESNKEVLKSNVDLFSQNEKLITRIEIYLNDIETKKSVIKDLESKLDSYMEYVQYARYNIYGEYISEGGEIADSSELTNLMRQLVYDFESRPRVREDLSKLPIADKVIARYPNFPFGYYVKYAILGVNRNPDWITCAKKAASIFKVTTAVEGHDITHEWCYNEIMGNLSLIDK